MRSPCATDTYAHPKHASQMPVVFTEQYALEQAIEEHCRAVDVECLANIQKAKDHIIRYGWVKVSLTDVLL